MALSEAARARVLNAAAFALRALGRLEEAVEPMRIGAEMRVEQESWTNAAVGFGNLSQLQLALGRLGVAVADARTAVDFADRSSSKFQRLSKRTALASALHQHGEREAAAAGFAEAMRMQAPRRPNYPQLYSLRGFQYSDLLLAEAERAAWRGKSDDVVVLQRCHEVKEGAAQTLSWATRQGGLLNIALDHLTLGRCALHAALLQGQPPDAAQVDIERAVAGLRAAGRQDHIPRGLLTRAWLRHHLDDAAGAKADLDEAWRIATRGGMKLHQADVCLYRARLFKDKDALKRARELIEECEYFRRLRELEDAEAELGVVAKS